MAEHAHATHGATSHSLEPLDETSFMADHRRTYDLFLKLVKWGSAVVIVFLIWMFWHSY